MERLPVLLDTDIGSDIDDAVALAYLLCQPRCELVGITTVTGDVQRRAALAEIVCRAAGRTDIPIVPGRRDPLLTGPGQPHVPQFEPVSHLPHRLDRPEGQAVEFLRQTIRERPGEIVLLSIGPLANVALLFGADPEIPRLLRGVVSMAGCFFSPDAEWNCRCDPYATAMVCASRRAGHRWVGLDVTRRVTMAEPDVRTRFVGEPLATVLQMAEPWFRERPTITFHDPLAAAWIFEEALCTARAGSVAADPATGQTTFAEGSGMDEVAAEVDAPAFFEHFFSVFERSA